MFADDTGHVEPGGYDQVIFRGDVAAQEFIAFWLKDNRVLAGMNANIWDVTDPIQALIRSRAAVDPRHLTDTTYPLDALLPANGRNDRDHCASPPTASERSVPVPRAKPRCRRPLFPGARQEGRAGAGHVPMCDDRQLVTDVLRDWHRCRHR